jgi:hypothetical protein
VAVCSQRTHDDDKPLGGRCDSCEFFSLGSPQIGELIINQAHVCDHPIPGPSHGFDGMPAKRSIDLVAQVPDLDINDVGVPSKS